MADEGGNSSRPPAARELYPIKDSRDFRTGLVSDRRQVVMGLLCPYLVAVFFDPEGNLLGTQKRDLPFMREQQPPYNIYDKRVEDHLRRWQEEIGYSPKTIKVKRFMIPEGVGIEDLPGEYQEVLDNPSQFEEGTKQDYAEWTRLWQATGQFVFWWAKDYWMSREGAVKAT
jgi:hypothetical protein